MDRITGAWQQLARREQVLAIVAAVSLLLLGAFIVFSGGEEVAPIDASTTATDDLSGPVKPTPGMIVSTNVPPPATKDTPTPRGMAPVAVAESGELPDGAMEDVEGKRIEAESRKHWKPVPAVKGPPKPAVSASVKSTGRNLEAVARAFQDCIAKRPAWDKRGCVNVMKYGVTVENMLHDGGKGATFTARSSDGHKVELTIVDGEMCRTLDGGASCDGWTSG